MEDIILLKAGRHIRPKPYYKLIIARDEAESNFLSGYRKQFIHMQVRQHRGPIILIDGQPTVDDLVVCARIAGRFCSGREEAQIVVDIAQMGEIQTLQVKPMLAEEIPTTWYL